EVVGRLMSGRSGHITYINYIAPLWRTFWSHGFPRMHVEADGQLICDEPALVFVGNIPRYGLGLPMFWKACADDTKLDLCIYRCASRPQLLKPAMRTTLRQHVGAPGVPYTQVSRITVRSYAPVPIELDGDIAGHVRGKEAPVALRIEARALRIALP